MSGSDSVFQVAERSSGMPLTDNSTVLNGNGPTLAALFFQVVAHCSKPRRSDCLHGLWIKVKVTFTKLIFDSEAMMRFER
jgi:hypothetical protein